jgi:hypothetical protein
VTRRDSSFPCRQRHILVGAGVHQVASWLFALWEKWDTSCWPDWPSCFICGSALISSGSVPLSALQAGHNPSAALGLLVKVGLERPTRSKKIAFIKDRGARWTPTRRGSRPKAGNSPKTTWWSRPAPTCAPRNCPASRNTPRPSGRPGRSPYRGTRRWANGQPP